MTRPASEADIQEVRNGDIADWTAARAPLLEGLAKTKRGKADWMLRAVFTFPGPGPLPV